MNIAPSSLTVLPTYKCTAKCEQCCFGSSPRLTERLSLATILERIEEAASSFTSLRHVTFSGGEAMLLKQDLLEAIKLCSSKRFSTRLVSNGFWASRPEKADLRARALKEAGLTELNLSTGLDHSRFVAVSTVLTAAQRACHSGIRTLITVEADTPESGILKTVLADIRTTELVNDGRLKVICNSWVTFNSKITNRRRGVSADTLRKGCSQIFDSITITPFDQLATCCGLTMEHIPEMRIGKIEKGNLKQLYRSQLGDFLKIWLRVDGPYRIIERIMGPEAADILTNVDHICQACVLLHKDASISQRLIRDHENFSEEVLGRFILHHEIASAMEKGAVINEAS